MKKTKIGIVTTWGDCGMGYIAKNWIYTIEKFPELFEHQIFSRAVKKFTPFRWYGQNIIQGPESMDINHSIFWEWIENFKPDVILFQDQNRYSKSKMVDESEKLKKIGIKLINYPDWIYRDDLQNYRGLYDINLAHVNRNYRWLQENNLESPVLIKWGVILKNDFNLCKGGFLFFSRCFLKRKGVGEEKLQNFNILLGKFSTCDFESI